MEFFEMVIYGFSQVFELQYIIASLAGAIIGTIIGALPGLGPSAGVAVLLPVVFTMRISPDVGIILFGAVYYGAMYGGRIPAILLNIPGTGSSVMTTLDGHPLAVQGKGGIALTIGTLASFFGSMAGIIMFIFLTPIMAQFALGLSSADFFWLLLVALIAVCGVSVGGEIVPLKAYAMLFLGFIISMIGTDPLIGTNRLTFGSFNLMGGIRDIPIIIGVFGFAEVIKQVQKGSTPFSFTFKWKNLWPKLLDYTESWIAVIQGSITGFIIGVLPGSGGTLASFIAYRFQKSISKNPNKMGKGAVEGVAAPESANNAASIGALIPMFALGVPGSSTTAILLVALIMWGVRPGPSVIVENADLISVFTSSMFIGNIFALLINLLCIPLFVYIIYNSRKHLNAIVTLLCVIGVYSVEYNMFYVGAMLFFGIFGYVFKQSKYPMAPLILGVILGERVELSFRRALLISNGNFSTFFKSNTSIILFILLILILFLPFFLNRIKQYTNTYKRKTI